MPSGVRLLRRFLVVAIFCASLFAFDRLLSAAFERTVFSQQQQQDLARKLGEARENGPYDVLVMGTSRAYEAIHPTDLQDNLGARTYKEAFQGKGPRYQYEFYRRFREVVGKPKVVVYGVDYFIFSIRSTPTRLAAFGIKVRPEPTDKTEWPLLLVRDKEVNDQALVWALQNLQAGGTRGRREPNRERFQSDMEEYRGSSKARNGDPAEPEPATYVKIPFKRFPGEEGEYFEKLLADLDADGVSVLLVGLPDFIATYRSDFQQRKFVQTFTTLAARHRRCVFVNYNRPDRFPLANPAYFLDGKYGNPNSHLSRAGVAPLLQVLLPDLKAALTESARP
jgi:hypothetical protein